MDKIIVMYEKADHEQDMSVYQFVEEHYRHHFPIAVCHVTLLEFCVMREQIKQLGSLGERFGGVHKIGYSKSRCVIIYDDQDQNLLVSNYDKPDQRGSYVIDENGIRFVENGYQITNHPELKRFAASAKFKVYTTESYKDIVQHYSMQHFNDYQVQQKMDEIVKLIGGRSCGNCCTSCWKHKKPAEVCEKWSYTIH